MQRIINNLGLGLISALLAQAPLASAQAVTVQGSIEGLATWTSANNPYILAGDVIVAPGATLTIESGVEVQAAASDASAVGMDLSRVEFVVLGGLQVQGTAGNPVRFTTSGADGAWYGLSVRSSEPVSVVHAIIEKAQYGLRLESSSTSAVTISGTTFRSCVQRALAASSGTITVDHSVFASNAGSVAISFAGMAAATLSHVTVAHNAGTALHVANNAEVVLINSVIVSNANIGAHLAGGSLAATYNDVWGNALGDYSGMQAGAGSISLDPNFAASADYRLRFTSPCRGAGSDSSDLGAVPFQVGPVTRVAISPTSTSVAAGADVAFAASAFDDIDSPVSNAVFTWSVKSAAGEIDQQGKLTAGCAPGTFLGAVTVEAAGTSASADVAISSGPALTAEVTPASAEVLPGASVQFAAQAFDRCGNVLDGLAVEWSCTAGGEIDAASGAYTAGIVPGQYSVSAQVGAATGSASVIVLALAADGGADAGLEPDGGAGALEPRAPAAGCGCGATSGGVASLFACLPLLHAAVRRAKRRLD